MTDVTLITHAACLGHDPGPYHPESPGRLRAILEALEGEEFTSLQWKAAPLATEEELARAHGREYVRAIMGVRLAPDAHVQLDADTVMSEASTEAALRAAGAAICAVDAVMEGSARVAFAAVRPPGHHAERARPMGFCLFNNVAVAAFHARARWGVRRLAVADFDVHHGNGTQAIFEAEPEFLYASSHQSPCFPGTGSVAGRAGAAGNIINAPLPPEADGEAFRAAWRDTLLPALDAFAPELLLVSAGFDAHLDDPLAELNVGVSDFAWLTSELMAVADRHCNGRLVSVLEGGYDLAALAESTTAHVRALMRA